MKISRNALIGLRVLTLFLALVVIALEVRILTQPAQASLQPCASCAKTAPPGQPMPIHNI